MCQSLICSFLLVTNRVRQFAVRNGAIQPVSPVVARKAAKKREVPGLINRFSSAAPIQFLQCSPPMCSVLAHCDGGQLPFRFGNRGHLPILELSSVVSTDDDSQSTHRRMGQIGSPAFPAAQTSRTDRLVTSTCWSSVTDSQAQTGFGQGRLEYAAASA
jgi:hypothetical protein